jgi:hypothetical protein
MLEREYIVTLHHYEDLDSFYEDMESPGGNLYIPNRSVECTNQRPTSRNTHYRLTEQEADQVRQDSRVLAVELTPEESGVMFVNDWTQISNRWDKSAEYIEDNTRNWALLRCTDGQQRPGWGAPFNVNPPASAYYVTAQAVGSGTGKNVDVVIVDPDGNVKPDHPEFAVNPDGTGGSRAIEYNWYQDNPGVFGTAPDTYLYSYGDHPTQCASVAAGNRDGWAKDANIYSIDFTTTAMDYVRYFHKNKPINSATGRRNPTITNHSYSTVNTFNPATITEVRFRGTVYTGPFNNTQLTNFGIYIYGGSAYLPVQISAYMADYQDAIADGVIMAASGGNFFTKIDTYSPTITRDYNNYAKIGSTTYYPNRGTSTTYYNSGIIATGAIGGYDDERKASYSHFGPRIDVFAPSGVSAAIATSGGLSDDRNSSFKRGKFSGTSASAPQVAGVLANLAEVWPRMNQSQAVAYITSNATVNQIYDVGSTDLADQYSLQGAPNRFLYAPKERPVSGNVYPKSNQGLRPSSGQSWPRTKIYRYGKP